MVKRLHANQLEGTVKFEDEYKFIRSIDNPEKNKYKILTSNYWIDKVDVTTADYTVEIVSFEGE